jgi:hypothetical protein
MYGQRLTHFEVSTVRLAVRGSVVSLSDREFDKWVRLRILPRCVAHRFGLGIGRYSARPIAPSLTIHSFPLHPLLHCIRALTETVYLTV